MIYIDLVLYSSLFCRAWKHANFFFFNVFLIRALVSLRPAHIHSINPLFHDPVNHPGPPRLDNVSLKEGGRGEVTYWTLITR